MHSLVGVLAHVTLSLLSLSHSLSFCLSFHLVTYFLGWHPCWTMVTRIHLVSSSQSNVHINDTKECTCQTADLSWGSIPFSCNKTKKCEDVPQKSESAAELFGVALFITAKIYFKHFFFSESSEASSYVVFLRSSARLSDLCLPDVRGRWVLLVKLSVLMLFCVNIFWLWFAKRNAAEFSTVVQIWFVCDISVFLSLF